jgi:phenylpyruvate tautomerase PptA (4-oxalocrotonate tautomerase family)
MAQIKIFAHREFLTMGSTRADISRSVHGAVMAALALPADKVFHRFIGLEAEDFVHPEDRGPRYTIIEISMFEGRTAEAKKQLIGELFTRLASSPGIEPHSFDITIFETPRHNWGIRGLPGDELPLSYQVNV